MEKEWPQGQCGCTVRCQGFWGTNNSYIPPYGDTQSMGPPRGPCKAGTEDPFLLSGPTLLADIRNPWPPSRPQSLQSSTSLGTREQSVSHSSKNSPSSTLTQAPDGPRDLQILLEDELPSWAGRCPHLPEGSLGLPWT